jgi:hypothetical protein
MFNCPTNSTFRHEVVGLSVRTTGSGYAPGSVRERLSRWPSLTLKTVGGGLCFLGAQEVPGEPRSPDVKFSGPRLRWRIQRTQPFAPSASTPFVLSRSAELTTKPVEVRTFVVRRAHHERGGLARTIREDRVFAHSRPRERVSRSCGFRHGAYAPCPRLTRANPERRPAGP